jgi:biotin carboxyl carrier protein
MVAAACLATLEAGSLSDDPFAHGGGQPLVGRRAAPAAREVPAMKWVVRTKERSREVIVERVAGGFEVVLDGERRRVELERLDGAIASLRYVDDGRSFSVSYQRDTGRRWRLAVGERDFDSEVLTPVEAIEAEAAAAVAGPSAVIAPIPGKVVKVHVAVGDEVAAGQPLVVLEAMKMENELTAEQAGVVTAVHVEPGRTVDTGTVLVELE